MALVTSLLAATPIAFDIPAQPAPAALDVFIKQSGAQVVYLQADVKDVQTNAVKGDYTPAAALGILLKDTGLGYTERRAGRFTVGRATANIGSIRGTLLNADGRPLRQASVTVEGSGAATVSGARGDYAFNDLAPGTYTLIVQAAGYQTLQLTEVRVAAGRELTLSAQRLRKVEDEVMRLEPYRVSADQDRVTHLDPYEVTGRRAEMVAGGNLDLPRLENDPLPYLVFTRSEIQRSGATELNSFLYQNLIEGDGTTLPREKNIGGSLMSTDSTVANLRSFGIDQTVVLVHGRRVPGTANGASATGPNLNSIPISLIERIEVLPASASALYGANAVGGVINIILRPNYQMTELTTSYDTAAGYDAGGRSVLLVHGRSLLDGRFRYRVTASYNKTTPPTEEELGFTQAERARELGLAPPPLTAGIFGATPNIRSTNGSPLFGPGTSPVTSVAPGADGTGGLAAFASRQGVRNFGLFSGPDGITTGSLYDLHRTYGQRRAMTAYSGSIIYQATDWLEFSLDAGVSINRITPGYTLGNFTASVPVGPLNPFNQPVTVAFQDAAWDLGEGYNRSTTTITTFAAGALVKLPGDFKLTLDAQQGRSAFRYRQVGFTAARVTELITQGLYNPFRDTQVFRPPQAFYDRAVFYLADVGSSHDPSRDVAFGTHTTEEYSARLTHQALPLPTGRGAFVVGANLLRSDVESFLFEFRYLDGTTISPTSGGGRSTYDWGVYSELQAPLVPARWLPKGIKALEGHVAHRYAGSLTYETEVGQPTFGLKLGLAGGFTLRGTYTSAYRPPTPLQSVPTTDPIPTLTTIGANADPRRPGDVAYQTQNLSSPNPDLVPEDAETTTLGLIFQRGKVHQLRASLDYVRTEKTNEISSFGVTTLLANESVFPDRITRAPVAPGDPFPVGRVTFVRSGFANVLGRTSENWTGSLRYAWTEAFGGTLEAYGRMVMNKSFRTQLLATQPVVENIENPDGSFTGTLKYRATLGAGWSNLQYGFGLDGRYFHPRVVPRAQQAAQGGDRVDRYWEFDVYAHANLNRFLPWDNKRVGLRGQIRVSNVLGADFPFYAAFSGNGDVQAYGDWRGRVYSLSLTATF